MLKKFKPLSDLYLIIKQLNALQVKIKPLYVPFFELKKKCKENTQTHVAHCFFGLQEWIHTTPNHFLLIIIIIINKMDEKNNLTTLRVTMDTSGMVAASGSLVVNLIINRDKIMNQDSEYFRLLSDFLQSTLHKQTYQTQANHDARKQNLDKPESADYDYDEWVDDHQRIEWEYPCQNIIWKDTDTLGMLQSLFIGKTTKKEWGKDGWEDVDCEYHVETLYDWWPAMGCAPSGCTLYFSVESVEHLRVVPKPDLTLATLPRGPYVPRDWMYIASVTIVWLIHASV